MTDRHIWLPVNAWFVNGTIYHDEGQAHDIAFKHGAQVFQCFRRIDNPEQETSNDEADS